MLCVSGRSEKYQVKGSRGHCTQHMEVTGSGLGPVLWQFCIVVTMQNYGVMPRPSAHQL
jgi:hypothetical protein